jgi:outer membrane lipoprotein LolB
MFRQNVLQSINKRFAILSMCTLSLVIASCANQTIRTETEKNSLWENHHTEILNLRDWELAGRMAVRVDNDAWSASLFWIQTGDSFEMRIIAPLAQGTALITGDKDSILLKTSDNREFSDKDVNEILKNSFGWSIPLNALKYWIRGIPNSTLTSDKFAINDSGHLQKAEQDGWSIDYQRYDLTKEIALPSRIEFSRSGTQVRIVINRWDLN